MATHEFTVNGEKVSVDVDDDVRLLWVLRDLLGITGPKYGCGINVCKACTSHLNGKAFNPCSVRVGDLRSKRRDHHDRGPARHGRQGPAPHAGGVDQPRRGPVRLLPARPDHGRRGPGQAGQEGEAAVTEADLDSIRNVCRCGTYHRIREAIVEGAQSM